jgi:hypothetical protein
VVFNVCKRVHQPRRQAPKYPHARSSPSCPWRRVFVQRLADIGMNTQQAQKLSGHADLGAMNRYLLTTRQTLAIPAAALPDLRVSSVPFYPSIARQKRIKHDSPLAPVAQLDRASDFESGGRRFESCRAR